MSTLVNLRQIINKEKYNSLLPSGSLLTGRGQEERSGVMKRLYTIILLFVVIIPMMAQIRVSAPQQVAVGEQFRLQYII